MSISDLPVRRAWIHQVDDNTLYWLHDRAREALGLADTRAERWRAEHCLERVAEELHERGVAV